MRNKLAILLSALLFLVMITFIQPSFFPNGVISINTFPSNSLPFAPGLPGITGLLFNVYILPFEIITFLLLAAMLGAMYLGDREGMK